MPESEPRPWLEPERLAELRADDARRFAHRLREAARQPSDRRADLLAAIRREADAALSAQRARLALPLDLGCPPDLPICGAGESIIEAVRAHPVVVICGETGSGKTTQLPKLCLAAGRGRGGWIGHTQPRRIAARSVAARLASELGVAGTDAVACKVRFEDATSALTRVKLMTDGILLAELQRDRALVAYDTIIIDEAHERSINIDLLLGHLRGLIERRDDLRVLITSATIDPQQFADFFGGAPVIEVPGRSYPVDIRHAPLADARETAAAIVAEARRLLAGRGGDGLVFVPGEREIRDTARALSRALGPRVEVLPLYARLPAIEQQRVFNPQSRARIVVATNVAETSITVPRVRWVIDTGLARIARFSARSRIARLPVEPIAQAAANQRAGRCGRIAPGECVRLYDADDFARRPRFTEPEITRSNLAAVVLQLHGIGVQEPAAFAFPTVPDPSALAAGERLLVELHALDRGGRLTNIGRALARLPVDPRVGRILYEAHARGVLDQALIICAALSVVDPRERPQHARKAAAEAHAQFAEKHSDFVGWLKLWDGFESARVHHTNAELRDWCQRNFLSLARLWEWRDVHRQLRRVVRELGWINAAAARRPDEALHLALLTGFSDTVGRLDHDGLYRAMSGRQFRLAPESALAGKPPPWVFAAELVQTHEVRAAIVARLQPRWIEQIARERIRSEWVDPHWNERSGRVECRERRHYGQLVLGMRPGGDFARHDAAGARRIFIDEVLAGDLPARLPTFHAANRALFAGIEALGERLRRPEITPSPQKIADVYALRLPDDVHDAPGLVAWLNAAGDPQGERLRFTLADWLDPGLADGIDARFPDRVTVEGTSLALSYRYNPGADDDGLTVRFPLAALPLVADSVGAEIVPGWQLELVTALLRGLPKAVRRSLGPAPDRARSLLAVSTPPAACVARWLVAAVRRETDIELTEAAIDFGALPDWLRPRFCVINEQGRDLQGSRDLIALKHRLGSAAGEAFTTVARRQFTRAGIAQWDFGSLPERVDLGQGLAGYPALIARADGAVDLDVLPSAIGASRAHRAGLIALARRELGATARAIDRGLAEFDREWLPYHALPALPEREPLPLDAAGLRRALTARAIEQSCFTGAAVIRDAQAFGAALEAGAPRLAGAARELAQRVGVMLGAAHRIRVALRAPAETSDPAWLDMDRQLNALVYRGFVSVTPLERFVELPRYLAALEKRIEKRRQNPLRDRERYAQFANAVPVTVPAPDDPRRWLVESYRIQVFAQEVGAPEKVSPARIAAAWAEAAER
ncbi:MAG: ATP-dependent RNA helicase HrpA [Chromatiales bacterium]|nr:ATP-dependent RNA helicase HrpA [Chromatiales bacterium]